MIVLGFNKMLAAPTVSIQGFTCKVNGNAANIKSLVPDSLNSNQVFLTIDQGLSSTDKILLSHAGGQLLATDGTMLETFSDLPVVNNLPVYMPVPGKVEAEDFFYNQGLSLETTTDVGGGQNIGYTDPGDYLDYRINVQKSGLYNMELRVAAFNTTGSLQVVQMNEKNEILNTATVSIPVTGGWQTWKSIYAEVSLTMGASKLRIKIVKSGFNLNWFKFYDKSQGINEHGLQHIRIFPNPAHQVLTIENELALPLPGSIRLMNLRGVQIRSVAMNRNESICRIFVGDLPKGFYFVELEGSGTISRQKLIIQ
jgi:hypothetical protein